MYLLLTKSCKMEIAHVHPSFFILCSTHTAVCAADSAMDTVLHATTSYFKPVQGKIFAGEGKTGRFNHRCKGFWWRQAWDFKIWERKLPSGILLPKNPLELESLVGKLQVKESLRRCIHWWNHWSRCKGRRYNKNIWNKDQPPFLFNPGIQTGN